MIIFPVMNFFVSRGKIIQIEILSLDIFLNRLHLDANKANTYSAVVSIVTIYLLLFIYIMYYFREDFRQVFCKKKATAVKPQYEKKQN